MVWRVAAEGVATGYHLVDLAPVGKSADVAVVYPYVHLQLAGVVVVVLRSIFFRVVTVDGIELNTSLAAPFYRFVEELSFADRPQDELVLVCDEHLQRLCSKGTLFTNCRIFVFNDGTVEVYCDSHYNSQLTIHN